ncbi:MAG: thrombospondin type 3 repeat-containing protein [Deltaproteobacteria bacterium]|nr:thrombospondin type 3 repeat-containing protein [Deltaproteobacteria bacterium]
MELSMRTFSTLLTLIVALAGLSAGCGSGSDGGGDISTIDTGPGKDPGTIDDPGQTDPGTVPDPGVMDSGTQPEIPVGEDMIADVDTGPTPGGFGWPCTIGRGHIDCFSGFCVPSDQGPACTDLCYEDCPSGWSCSLFQLTGMDPVFICLQTSTNLCRPCITDDECSDGASGIPGSRCIEFSEVEGSFCGLLCAANKDCPDGYACIELELPDREGTTMQCLPESGECNCSPYAIQLGAKTQCFAGEEGKVCSGHRVCISDGLSDCDAPEPKAEECDGLDNDCDGDTDEEVALSPCTVTSELGECSGWTKCVDGAPVCDAPAPGPEECDGLDNDCDGDTDEGFDDTDDDGTADCVDTDDDDDGILDEPDNCQFVPNPKQENYDFDSWGDACDDDDDNDEIPDVEDNCPQVQNPGQENADDDEKGNVCDEDDDNDDVFDEPDNCPLVYNPDQADVDGDGKGDVCDGDSDGDGIPDDGDNSGVVGDKPCIGGALSGCDDNCTLVSNQSQADLDNDGEGDVCDDDDDGDDILDVMDNCPVNFNPDQMNSDGDGFGDVCDDDDDGDGKPDLIDNCPTVANPGQADMDNDNVGDVCDDDIDGDLIHNEDDNCPEIKNPQQDDFEGDGMGDPCDPDDENDGVPDLTDNCPWIANPDQGNIDKDAFGDVCDNEKDGDGVPNEVDNCPDVPNPSQGDLDLDEIGDVCDPDKDGDGVANESDNCEFFPNEFQEDSDLDGQGDVCDNDDDNDGKSDQLDNCQFIPNPDQENQDGDEFGDVCDDDDDNDGVLDGDDNCPMVKNGGQENHDSDAMGNACDPDDDNDGSLDGTDCEPLNAAVFPGAQEVCNGIDDNCVNGADEEGASACGTWHYDADDDGYGTSDTKCLCNASGLYRADKAGDCKDTAAEINPGATEKCNGIDDNCDSLIDPEGSQGGDTFFKDHDDDGFGVSGDHKKLCTASGDYTADNGGDCNDNNGNIHPNATETCNGLDDDCDGAKDPENSSGCTNYYKDSDADGYEVSDSRCTCSSPGYPYTVTTPHGAKDCCDSDGNAFPGQGNWFVAKNNCNSWDYDCSGSGDRQWTSTHGFGCVVTYLACICSGGGQGWNGGAPSCGNSSTWVSDCSNAGLCGDCSWSTQSRQQQCH